MYRRRARAACGRRGAAGARTIHRNMIIVYVYYMCTCYVTV